MPAQTPNLIPLTPWAINTYLIRGDRPVLVDTGTPQRAPAILRALAQCSIQPSQLALIVLTHGHFDHFGGVQALRHTTSAPIAAHVADEQTLRLGRNPAITPLTVFGRLLLPLTQQNNRPALPVQPDVWLENDADLRYHGVPARIIHTPGHTDGFISILVDDGSAVIGDLLSGSLFFPHRPNWPYFINKPADQPRILTSLKKLLDAGATQLYPGHGHPFDRASAIRWLTQQQRSAQ